MDVLVLTFKLALLAISVLMIGLILLQESQGGGWAGLSGTKAAEAEGVRNPVRRFTGILAASWFVVAIALAIVAH